MTDLKVRHPTQVKGNCPRCGCSTQAIADLTAERDALVEAAQSAVDAFNRQDDDSIFEKMDALKQAIAAHNAGGEE